MNEQRTKEERITELKNKIYYAESAREAYKAINVQLYETNTLYAETLRRELESLEES